MAFRTFSSGRIGLLGCVSCFNSPNPWDKWGSDQPADFGYPDPLGIVTYESTKFRGTNLTTPLVPFLISATELEEADRITVR